MDFSTSSSSLCNRDMEFYLPIYLPKNPRDLARAGQDHTVTSFLGDPWPVAISFVLGSQTREQICNNDTQNIELWQFLIH